MFFRTRPVHTVRPPHTHARTAIWAPHANYRQADAAFSEESGFTGFGPQNKLESPPVKISLNPQNLNPTEHLTSCQHHFAALGIIKFRFIQLYMLNEFYNE